MSHAATQAAILAGKRGDVYAGLLVLPWLLDGAQWHPYVEPPDPFAEPVPSLRERVEALPVWPTSSGAQ